MSRIGKKPINVPSGVNIKLDDRARSIGVSGPKGDLKFEWVEGVSVNFDEGDKKIQCSIPESDMGRRDQRAHWGTTRARIQNMVTGVSEGFVKKLNIVGVGWNAKLQGKNVQLNIGYCHPIDLQTPEGVQVEIENNNRLTITGADKHAVGQFAAVIRDKRRPEPYNGKGILYDGEVIIRKQGKVFGA
ncbi:MAG: 50S ribosomal protein L6 [Phycisphaerae bacterium]|nr:50S ribosomal protein L6 [Phycisphaerae bacterium]|tara:strand:+ start:1508 stop:2068 length:561 start_codon:yes stop_codon:yes gene_type:complete